jgi:hypothetical protein
MLTAVIQVFNYSDDPNLDIAVYEGYGSPLKKEEYMYKHGKIVFRKIDRISENCISVYINGEPAFEFDGLELAIDICEGDVLEFLIARDSPVQHVIIYAISGGIDLRVLGKTFLLKSGLNRIFGIKDQVFER